MSGKRIGPLREQFEGDSGPAAFLSYLVPAVLCVVLFLVGLLLWSAKLMLAGGFGLAACLLMMLMILAVRQL